VPELPEVENIVRSLRPELVGRQITGFRLLWERTVAAPSPEAFQQMLVGQEVRSVRRRGKFLVFDLSGGQSLLVHLRMTGQLGLCRPGEPASRHVRAAFDLDDGRELRFVDQRKFGRLWLVDDSETVLGKLGPEPLADDFTPAAFRERLAGRRARIKALLLDQRFLAGVGNIYADEALYVARVHPCRPASDLAEEEAERLFQAMRQVLRDGIAHGGTTLDSYRRPDGSEGDHQNFLQVFRRAGEACPRCGTPAVRLVVGGRSTFFCPLCQPEGGDSVGDF